eukprot:8004919-Karenia_brevis.AAC.1
MGAHPVVQTTPVETTITIIQLERVDIIRITKRRMGQGANVSLEIGIDYTINEKMVATCSFLYTYPSNMHVGQGAQITQRYERFRNSLLLIQRERPVTPCPQNCPLPGKRMSKNSRSKIFS